jgi:hypothetical protein
MKIKTSSQQVPISLSDLKSPFTIKEWIKNSLKDNTKYSNSEIIKALDVIIKGKSFNERSDDTKKRFIHSINMLKQKLENIKDSEENE